MVTTFYKLIITVQIFKSCLNWQKYFTTRNIYSFRGQKIMFYFEKISFSIYKENAIKWNDDVTENATWLLGSRKKSALRQPNSVHSGRPQLTRENSVDRT